ncbi:unnamed protein product [Boreogadus saida]
MFPEIDSVVVPRRHGETPHITADQEMIMASRCGDANTGLNTTTNRRDASGATGDDDATKTTKNTTALPRWMRLYFYGMHGVAVDVLLSSFWGIVFERDPKLVGYSSPYLCLAHCLTHWALERLHARRKLFPGGPAVFSLVLYPCVYIGLHILLLESVNIGARAGPGLALAGVTPLQIAVQYLVALYFSHVFHPWLSRLRYHHPGPHPGFTEHKNGVQVAEHGGLKGIPEHGLNGLPDMAHLVFYGMHGFLDEVVFTAAFNLMERRALGGHTSLWSFLMYGTCSFVVEKLYVRLRYAWGWGTWRRLPLYVAFIYAWELTSGLALRQVDACSWDYSHYPGNFMGLVTIVYLPGWMGLSLYQDVLSNVLFRVQWVGGSGEVEDGGEEEEEEGESGKMDRSKKLL